MKNKIFYPYIIIEFLLFIMTTLCSMGSVKIDSNYFSLASIALHIVFMALALVRVKMDRWFGLAFAISMAIGEVVRVFYSSTIAYIFFFLASCSLLYRLLNEKKSRYIIVLAIVGGLILVTNILLIIFSVWSLYYCLISAVIVLCATSVVLSVVNYKNCSPIYKGNWFFMGAGVAFYGLYTLCSLLSQFVPETAQLSNLIIMSLITFYVPSIILICVSFMFFEPREA